MKKAGKVVVRPIENTRASNSSQSGPMPEASKELAEKQNGYAPKAWTATDQTDRQFDYDKTYATLSGVASEMETL